MRRAPSPKARPAATGGGGAADSNGKPKRMRGARAEAAASGGGAGTLPASPTVAGKAASSLDMLRSMRASLAADGFASDVLQYEAMVQSGDMSIFDALWLCMLRGQPVPDGVAAEFMRLWFDYQRPAIEDFGQAIGANRSRSTVVGLIKSTVREGERDRVRETLRRLNKEGGHPLVEPGRSKNATAADKAAETDPQGRSAHSLWAIYKGKR